MTSQTMTPIRVGRGMIRARLDQAREKGYPAGVIGFRARPDQAEPYGFDHHGQPVRVVACVSALAVRDALREQPGGGWLVIITDRSDEDLGAGILAHLVGMQLRTPDPWDAVRHQFSATAVDAFLTVESREVAGGLLEVTPPQGWRPAPAGVLSRDHALGAVAETMLELHDPPDAISVLGWALRSQTPQRIADLRSQGRDPLTDAVLRWIADGTGAAGPLAHALLREGRAADLAPLGVVLELICATRRCGTAQQHHDADLALARLQHHWAPNQMTDTAIEALAEASVDVVAGLLSDGRHRVDVDRTLSRADALIAEAQAGDLADRSDLLPSGLRRRLHSLAGALQRTATDLDQVERGWERVHTHQLAATDRRTAAFHAAVRLRRWLSASDSAPGTDLAALTRRQLDIDGWVDNCVNTAAAGGDDDVLGAGLATVLARVQQTRDRHDAEFATALAAATRQGLGSEPGSLDHAGAKTWPLERLLPELVLPMATPDRPVLFLILDGMSTAASVDIMGSLLAEPAHPWAELLLDGSRRRAAGLAVLPSLTSVSRTSMLCGRLAEGDQGTERRGYAELTRSQGLDGAPLFHKADLDTVRPGLALADAVRVAIDDTEKHPLVTCVLNTIDDALDRSDPAGTTWTLDNVKHLGNLLSRAREAGRVVIITADHGHVIERRAGKQQPYPGISSGRSRPAQPLAADGEVLVEGDRVILHGGRAVLAVSERLRYGPLKAGYHGGAAAAEVVVPVIGLVPSQLAQVYSDRLAPPQEPGWWLGPLRPATAEPVEAAAVPDSAAPTLFDEPAPPKPSPEKPSLGQRVIATTTYEQQRQVGGRVSLADDTMARLIDTLAAARDTRISTRSLAAILAISPVRVNGALNQVSKLLNVEGYPVVRHDIATGTLIMDIGLLRDQYGLPA